MSEYTEKRLTRLLISYWESLSESGGLPQLKDFDSGELGDEAWGKCARFNVSADYPLFDYMGQEVIRTLGRDLTGESVNAVGKDFPGNLMRQDINTAIRKRKHVENDGYFLLPSSSKLVKYRVCSLPLGNKENEMSHVIFGLSYKIAGM